jgi:hypothetical protein
MAQTVLNGLQKTEALEATARPASAPLIVRWRSLSCPTASCNGGTRKRSAASSSPTKAVVQVASLKPDLIPPLKPAVESYEGPRLGRQTNLPAKRDNSSSFGKSTSLGRWLAVDVHFLPGTEVKLARMQTAAFDNAMSLAMFINSGALALCRNPACQLMREL